MAEKKVVYTYFDAYARGEINRLILTYNKVKFDDFRINRDQWAELKPKTKFGQVPILEIDGVQIAQSGAIARYLAQLHKQYPTDPTLILEAEELRDFFLLDINETFNRHWYLKDQIKADHLKKYFEELLPAYLSVLDKILQKGNGKYFVGDTLSLIDFYAMEFAQRILFNDEWKERALPALERHNALKAYFKVRLEDPNYLEYVKVRVNH